MGRFRISAISGQHKLSIISRTHRMSKALTGNFSFLVRHQLDSATILPEIKILLGLLRGSNRASGSIGELSVMVKEMQTSVAGFKLPGIDGSTSTVVQSADDLAAIGLSDEANK